MATEVKLPELGESVTEGTVTRWLKQVGDEVAADESLLEVSTDKVDTEIPSPAAGTLLEIKVREDETVDVGAELAVIGSGDAGGTTGGGEPAPSEPEQEPEPQQQEPEQPQQQEQPAAEETPEPAPEPAPPEPAQPAAQEAPAQAAPEPEPEQAAGTRDSSSYVTPLVRKMAAQHGVE